MRRLGVVLTLLTIAGAAGVQAQGRLPTNSVWDVEWRNPEGHFYTGVLQLQVLGGSKVEGEFTWTLRASPSAEEQAKLGMTGVEQVTGSYDPDAGILTFEGYRLDDPNGILGMDRYRIVVDPELHRMAGLTMHGGTWAGELKGARR